MPFRHFEDFRVGDVHELGSRAVTREEIVDFATRYDPQPFHVDEEAAGRSMYGGLIASGWQTVAIAMRLFVDGIARESSSMGSPGVDEIRWLRPVRPGDVLSGRAVVTRTEPSRSKPDRGSVWIRQELRNPDGELVLRFEGIGIYGRRPSGSATPR